LSKSQHQVEPITAGAWLAGAKIDILFNFVHFFGFLEFFGVSEVSEIILE